MTFVIGFVSGCVFAFVAMCLYGVAAVASDSNGPYDIGDEQ